MQRLRTLTLNSILDRLFAIGRPRSEITADRLQIAPLLVRLIQMKFEAVDSWLRQHRDLIREPKRFVRDLVWYDGARVDRLNSVLNILRRRRAELNAAERFELSSIYCLSDQTLDVWRELTLEQQQKYLAERMHQHDPIVIFWTGVCARQPWLSDSYLVRAFYWAAEHDHLQALEYFWEHIVQERADAVTFRAVRAFQLAACRGHLASLLFLWNVTTEEEQHRQMIQGALSYTQGALYAFESACKHGQYELVKFIFQEADHHQRVIILRAEECRAFRLAAEGGHVDVVRLFLEKSKRMKMRRLLLEAENCYAFRRALVDGHDAVVELIWTSVENDDDRRMLLNSILFSEDMRELIDGSNRCLDSLWRHSPVDLRSALFSQYVVPSLVIEVTDKKSLPKSFGMELSVVRELGCILESWFFDICALESIDHVRKYVRRQLTLEYGVQWSDITEPVISL